MNNIDHAMILIVKILLPLSVLLLLKVYIPEQMMPFRDSFNTVKLSFWGLDVTGNDIYLSCASALLAFFVSTLFEVFLRTIKQLHACYVRRNKLQTHDEVTTRDGTFNKPDETSAARPKVQFDNEVTFRHVIEELKNKLNTLGANKLESTCPVALSSSYNLRSTVDRYLGISRTNCSKASKRRENETDTSTREHEHMPIGDDHREPSISGEQLSNSSAGKAVVSFIPYKRREHIYAEIIDNADLKITSSKTESQSSEESLPATDQSSSPSPSTVLLTLQNLEDQEKDSLNRTVNASDPLEQSTDGFPQDTRSRCKKDCRRSRYKGANRNSSCAAGHLPSVSSISLQDEELAAKMPSAEKNTTEVRSHKSDRDNAGSLSQPTMYQDRITSSFLQDNPVNEMSKNVSSGSYKQFDGNDKVFHPPKCVQQNIALYADGPDDGQFARGDCHSPSNMEDTASVTSSTRPVRYRDVLTKGTQVKRAVIVRGKVWIDNFRDMAKAVIRSLSLSSDDASQESVSKETSLHSYENVPASVANVSTPETCLILPNPQLKHVMELELSPLPRSDKFDESQKPKMRKQLNHGVTLVYPQAKDLSILHRLRYWFSNLLGSSSSSSCSDGSETADSEVGCMSNLRNTNDQRRRSTNFTETRKQVVSETFTYVTMSSSLLDEPVQPSWFRESTVYETGEIPDVVHSSIFKGMAKKLPIMKSSTATVSNEDMWNTAADVHKRYHSRNKNNNMNKTVQNSHGSSSRSSLPEDLQNDLINLLANPFSDVEDSVSADNLKSSHSNCNSVEGSDAISIDQPHSRMTNSTNLFHYQNCNKITCLYKTIHVVLIALNCCSLALSSFCVSSLCVENLKSILTLYGFTATIEIFGLDLIKAVFFGLICAAINQ